MAALSPAKPISNGLNQSTNLTTDDESTLKSSKLLKPKEADWTLEDQTQLVTNLSSCLPENDKLNYKTFLRKFDWKRVRFGEYSAAQCKDQWLQITSKLHLFRTMTDLVTDAKAWLEEDAKAWLEKDAKAKLENSSNEKKVLNFLFGKQKKFLPDGLRKPRNAFGRFLSEKKEEYMKDNPGSTEWKDPRDLKKLFNELPENEKRKYTESYKKDIEVYQQELVNYNSGLILFARIQFIELKHIGRKYKGREIISMWNKLKNAEREKLNEQAKVKHYPDLPWKPIGVHQRYLLEMEKEYLKDNPEFSEADLKKIKSFKQLPENEKRKYTEAHKKDLKVYRQELEKYKKAHPEMFKGEKRKKPSKVLRKTHPEVVQENRGKRKRNESDYNPELGVSIVEKKLKDVLDGEPSKVPRSGLVLFAQIKSAELKGTPRNDKRREIIRMWKKLENAEREKLNEQAKVLALSAEGTQEASGDEAATKKKQKKTKYSSDVEESPAVEEPTTEKSDD